MFENLVSQPPDKIMALMGLFSKDRRENKTDLGVGVYKDKSGNTPIMLAVKNAEEHLLKTQNTKSYVGLLGSLGFVDQIVDLTLGNVLTKTRIVGAQAPGGTGALHQLFLLLRAARSDTTVWLSSPTWPNHPAILKHLGLKTNSYRYFDDKTCSVDFGAMMDDLNKAKSGDVLLLHGCCHNPTGANLNLSQWSEITQLCLEKNLMPLIDIAYQGFGDGLDEDVTGLRLMASKVPDMMVGTSCSKNFGVYRDRVGTAIVVGSSQKVAKLAEDNLKSLNRLTFSFPPDHGATVVELILKNSDLKKQWVQELESMRLGMLDLRLKLSDALKKKTNSNRFEFVENHRGMFSRLGLTEDNVTKLRDEFGIYMVSDSRINIAGLQAEKIDLVATAVAEVI
jgi:aromatic-amino-acid transaminase